MHQKMGRALAENVSVAGSNAGMCWLQREETPVMLQKTLEVMRIRYRSSPHRETDPKKMLKSGEEH